MASKPQRTETSTESAAEWVPVGELHPWEENPRRNDGEPVRKVASSIKRYGFGAPIVARRANGEIIAGHTRYKAALELGLEKVPVRFLDLEEQEAHMLALADNRTSEEAQWDDVLLAQILAAAKAGDVDLAEAAAFDEVELSRLLAEKGENDPVAEWVDMPECENENQLGIQVIVHFASEEDLARFGALIEQPLTRKIKFIWYPRQIRASEVANAYLDGEP